MVINNNIIQDGINAIQAMDDQTQGFEQQAETLNFGPWQLSVHCKHGCNRSNDANYTIDFVRTRTNLIQGISKMDSQIVSEEVNLRNIMNTMGSLASEAIDKLDSIQNADSQFIIMVYMQSLLDEVQDSTDTLSSLNSSTATFQSNIQGHMGNVDSSVDSLDTEYEHYVAALNNSIGNQPCGQDSLNAQMQGFKSQFESSIIQLQSGLSSLKTKCTDLNHKLDQMLGQFVDFTSSWNDALSQVQQAADLEETSQIMAAMHISDAKSKFQELLDEIS